MSLSKLQYRHDLLPLLSRERRTDWINNIATGDENWCLYVNHSRKKQWLPKEVEPESDPKAELHPKKVMLCVFWDAQGIIWWELLGDKRTINPEVYCQQLLDLDDALKKKRPQLKEVLLLHDNSKPHVAFGTLVPLMELRWVVLPHPAYSPDLAPSDYHLSGGSHTSSGASHSTTSLTWSRASRASLPPWRRSSSKKDSPSYQ